MLGVVFLGDRKLALREFPDPAPGPRDVVLEIKASGMCGSDLHVYRASFKPELPDYFICRYCRDPEVDIVFDPSSPLNNLGTQIYTQNKNL